MASSTSRPRIGLALIVRDEEFTLPNLLDSVTGHVDVVGLLDTGSVDNTLSVAREWADRTGTELVMSMFEWVGDFAAARNAADDLLLTLDDPPDWLTWADADDLIEGAEQLRAVIDRCPSHVNSLVAQYAYLHDQHGNCVCTLPRERFVRAGAGRWVGRVHESQVIPGPQGVVSADLVRWVHHKAPDAADSNARNLDILRRWNEEEPGDPRVVGYLGTELAIRDETAEAVEFFREYLSLKTGWDEERAQIHRKLSACLLAHGEVVEAQSVALDALRVVPSWPETYLSLAECAYTLGEWGKAIDWARDVLRRGMPSTGLIVNPLDFTFKPRLIVAAALGQLGRIDDAIMTAREALALVPDHQELQRNLAAWEASSQREAVAETFCAQARLLVNHDEQAKALALLEDCVPYFATDHPMVVAERSRIRERLAWLRSPAAYDRHYKEGGSKPEDAVLDFVGVCDRLPRAQFLLAGLAEQAAA